MIKEFKPKHSYIFSLIEAINNSPDASTRKWLSKHMQTQDGQPVNVISPSAGTVNGIMINPWWCKEKE